MIIFGFLVFMVVLFLFSRTNLAMADLTRSQTDELIATTLDQYNPELINQTVLDIPMYQMFLNSKHKEGSVGGHRIRFPFIVDKNESFGWWGLNDTFNPQPKKILGWGHMTLKQGAGDVTIEDLETWMNSGEGAFKSIMKAKIDSLVQATKESLNSVAWGDGTGGGGKVPTGLTGHISATPTTGSYMGFSRSTDYWTRIWFDDGIVVGPHSLTSPTAGATPQAIGAIGDISDKYPSIIDDLNLLWESIGAKGEDKSEIFHITDLATMLMYKQIPLRTGVDIGLKAAGPFNIGVETPHFMGSPILSDTLEMGAQSGEWRTINMRYYRMYFDSAHMFKWVGPRSPYNALRTARYLVVRFNWACIMPRKQGFMTGIVTWTA